MKIYLRVFINDTFYIHLCFLVANLLLKFHIFAILTIKNVSLFSFYIHINTLSKSFEPKYKANKPFTYSLYQNTWIYAKINI